MKSPKSFAFTNVPSSIDNKMMFVAFTGLAGNSSNVKTGKVVQSHIICQDVKPTEAVKQGLDYSICGDCPKRGLDGQKRECYVNVGQGPQSVWKAIKNNSASYVIYDWNIISERREGLKVLRFLLEGKTVRIGSYGDPAAVPASIIQTAIAASSRHTGYTHQWDKSFATHLKGLVQASADNLDDKTRANALGWRTFRVRMAWEAVQKQDKELVCPASKEGGKKATCETCKMHCDGSRFDQVIIDHGPQRNRAQA